MYIIDDTQGCQKNYWSDYLYWVLLRDPFFFGNLVLIVNISRKVVELNTKLDAFIVKWNAILTNRILEEKKSVL